MNKLLKILNILIFLTLLTLGSSGIFHIPNIIISGHSNDLTLSSINDSDNNHYSANMALSKGKQETGINSKNNIQTVNSINGQNSFNRQGKGNGSLLKLNETFNIQETNITTNSFVFNQTSKNTFSKQNIPNYASYNLIEGYYNISNIRATQSIQTVEGSTKYHDLSSSVYSSVASSFKVNNSVKISSISIFYNGYSGSQSSRGFTLNIRHINQSGNPNGSILFQYSNTFSNGPANFQTFTFNPTILYSGIYALVLQQSNSLNYPVVFDNSTGDGVNESQMWVKSGQNWFVYEGDLPFYFTYINVDSMNNTLIYNSPQNINFKVNNTPLLNLSTNFNALNQVLFNVTTNTSVVFDLNYNLKFKKTGLLNIPTFYNISNDFNYWTTNFTVTSVPLLFNPIIQRNISLLNIPHSWNLTDIYNNLIQYTPIQQYYNASLGIYSFLDNNPLMNGLMSFNFIDVNQAKSITVTNQDYISYNNYTLDSTDTFQYIANMKFDTKFYNSYKTNISLTYSNNTIIATHNNSYPLQTGYSFSYFTINSYFDLNTHYQGQYALKFFWTNNETSEIGYYEQKIYFVIKTILFAPDLEPNYYIGENVSIKALLTDYVNNSLFLNSELSFSTDWGLSESLNFNFTSQFYEKSFSTSGASNGLHIITVYAKGWYFVNTSLVKTINVDIRRPSSLNLVSKSGFIDSSNNITQLSSTMILTFDYKNLINNSPILQTNSKIYLNGQSINITSNNIGLTFIATNMVSVSLNLDPSYNYKVGSYNLSLTTFKFGYLEQTKSFYFTIKGYDLLISIQSNENFIRDQTYNIKAIVGFATQSNSLQLSKTTSSNNLQAIPDSKYLSNIQINLVVSVTFMNNSQADIPLTTTTDQNGVANFELDNSQTSNLLSITKISASFAGNDYNNAKSVSKSVTITNANLSLSSNSDPFALETLLLYFIGLIIAVSIVFGGYFLYTNYLHETAEKNKEYTQKISTLVDFLGMYITNKDGLPIFLKSNQQFEDQNQHLMLSGVTYSIDLFLNNFKDEYSKKILKEDNISRTSNTGLVNMTVINQDKFKIIIGVSDSYRLYVLAKETNDQSIHIYQKVLENIEAGVQIHSVIINLVQIYPLFTAQIQKVFPVELVNEFEVKFPELVDCITKPEKQSLLGNSTINKLKEFSFYLIKNSNLSSIKLDEYFDFNTVIANSRKIHVDSFSLPKLITILKKINCSKKELYEILFLCSGHIFKNITPLSLPEEKD